MIFAAIADWADSKEYPVEFMCAQLEVSVSGYYAWRTRPASARVRADEALLCLIGMLFDRLKGNPGVRRMHAELAAQGHRVSRKRVWRLMRQLGLQGRHPRAWKKTTVHGERPVPAPDLIGRDFTASQPNQRWCGDITYIKSWEGWVYLATVIDLHSRRVVGWATPAYGVGGGGLLAGCTPTGPRDFRAHLPRFTGDNGAQNQRLTDALARVAAARGVTPVQLAIAWVRAKSPAGAPIIPTLGARTRAQLADALAALDVTLDTAEVAALEDAVPAHAVAGTRYAAPQMQHLDSER